MFKLICGISLIFFSVIVNVNSLQCYSCENCAKVTEDQLVTCGASTTVPPTTTPSGQTTSQATTQSPSQTTTPGQTTTPSQTTPDITTTTILYETTTTSEPITTTTPPPTTTEVTIVTTLESTEGSNANNARNYFASRVRREAVAVQEKADEYVCLTIKYKVNNTDVVSRLCGLDTDGKICEPAAIVNATCTTCKTDKCNSAVSIHVSLILMFIAIVFRFI